MCKLNADILLFLFIPEKQRFIPFYDFWGKICVIIIKNERESYKLGDFVGGLSEKICDIQKVSEKAKREEIEYGLEVVLSTVLSVVATLAVAFFSGMLKECFAFLAVFMPLRTYTGGYHASTHIRCFFVLMIDMLLGVLIMHSCKGSMYMTSWAMIVAAIIIIVAFSPIVHKNHPMSKRQQMMSRKKSIAILFVIVLIMLIETLLKEKIILFSGSYGLASVAISMMIAKYNKKRGEKNEIQS